MSEILRSRAAAPADSALDVQLRRAQAVARAGDAIPRGYRNNPGAVLLAAEWGAARGLDLLTALQGVAFVDGKPVIDATMQRALAKRAGYRVLVTHADDNAATVAVFEGGERLGEATYSMEDARHAGLAGKRNWQQHPKAMLVARATTQAMRWFAPDVMVGVLTVEEASAIDEHEFRFDPEPDGPELDGPEPDGQAAEPEAVEPKPADQPVELLAEPPVKSLADPPSEPEAAAERAGPMARGRAKAAIETAKTAGVWPAVVAELNTRRIPVRVASLTEQQAAELVELVDSLVEK